MAISQKEVRKFFAEIQSAARRGRPTAELIGRFDALSFARTEPQAFDAFVEAQSTSDVFGYLDAHPRSVINKMLTKDAQQRGAQHARNVAGSSAEAAAVIGYVSSTMEMTSTAKLAASQVAVGLGNDFLDALLATDFDNTATTGLHSPFPGPFVVRFPRGFYLQHQWQHGQRMLPLEIAVVAPLLVGGRFDPVFGSESPLEQNWTDATLSFLTTFRTGVSPQSDFEDPSFIQSNAVMSGLLPLSPVEDGATTVGQLSDSAWFPYIKSEYVQLDEGGNELRRGTVADLKKVIYGLLLYLNTHNPKLVRVSNRKQVALAQLVNAPDRARKIRATMGKAKMAQTVIVSEDVEALPREAYKTLVRGHFRNQPYGPKRSLRRIQWIKPFIRHKDAPGDPRGDYDIEGLSSDTPGDPDVPTYCGQHARQQLFFRYGMPNSWPRPGESPFRRCRVLFVDDERDGAPAAFWVPDDDCSAYPTEVANTLLRGFEEGLPGEWTCDEMYRELWGIQRDIKHVESGIKTHMFSDPEHTIELQTRLDELEDEYAKLYQRYQSACRK